MDDEIENRINKLKKSTINRENRNMEERIEKLRRSIKISDLKERLRELQEEREYNKAMKKLKNIKNELTEENKLNYKLKKMQNQNKIIYLTQKYHHYSYYFEEDIIFKAKYYKGYNQRREGRGCISEYGLYAIFGKEG